MEKRKLSIWLATLSVAVVLAGCSKEDDSNRLPDGEHPVILTATVEGQTITNPANRATSVGSWDGGEQVAMMIDGTVKQYTAAANGVLSATDPFYWATPTETKAVSAWHPYSANQPTSFSVDADQSSVGYQASDLIYTSQQITYNNSSLTFKHLPSKVLVNLKAGAGISEDDLQNATVTVLSQNLTSGTVDGDWNVSNAIAGNSSIVPNVLPTATTGYQKTVQALIVPQTFAVGTRLFKITIGSSGIFYYTVTNEQILSSGKQCTYHITVNATGITVSSQISDWTTEEVTGDAEMSIGSKSASQAAIGDFYFSDGSLEDKNASLTAEQKTACIGVVFWLGDPTNTTNGDPLLARDKSSCTHGLVVALHEAKKPLTNAAAKMKWSISYEQVNDWTNHNDRGGNKVNITEQNRYQGYANTVALKAYNHESANVQSNAGYKVLPIAATEQYSKDYPAPSNSSGWYVPSIMELKYMCWGQGNSESSTGRNLLNNQFAKVGGTNFDSLWVYWSSSELAGYSSGAWIVFFSDGGVDYFNKNSNECYVRAILAF